MEIKENYSLKNHNTFGIDVRAKYFIELSSNEQIVDLINEGTLENKKVLILSGGSNILFTRNFDGIVLKISTRGIRKINENTKHVFVRVNAGENWHDFVSFCIENNYGCLENLSLIPGRVGAAPIQNIGAYGVEQKDFFSELEAVDIKTGKLRTFSKDECRFGYRNSIFKKELKNRYIILSVVYKLLKNPEFNIGYGDISSELKNTGIKELSLKAISEAVCRIRLKKLPSPDEYGNAGSFFKNPIISKIKYLELKEKYHGIVAYPVDKNNFKLAAGWLIDKLGWKGKRIGDAGVCKTQALVLLNYGNASGDEILSFAKKIQQSVFTAFGVELEMEVNVC